ncbi:TetR family transcriptional regulator [Nocardioides sp. CN2-186]|uniref:TetR family transcriptional regulator n=1 Tax=Nocardioides tweenelious TaxID=3156607 RepID=UPI0032B5F628
MTEQTVGRAVRSARRVRGVSLRALARKLSVSPATISAIENDHTRLTVERLHRIAEILDVPASRLLRGEPTALPIPPGQPRPEAGSWSHYDDLRLDPVLAASARLFVAQGFHATSMRGIAAEASMSVAGIYHHFPSKERILVDLMDLTMAEIKWRLLAARDEGNDEAESFGLMVESLALFHAVRGDLAFLGASEMRGLSGADLKRIIGMRNEVQHLLDEQAALVAPGADVRIPCRAIATMCTSLPSWFRNDGPLTAEDVAKQYVAFAMALLEGATL